MNNISETTPFYSQQGRKGIAYDWQSLYAASLTANLDDAIASIAPAHAE